jgi:hypothetical protein
MQVILLGYSASVNSPTYDEVGHLVAGVTHWTAAEFDLYRVNPPLVRMTAAIPVLFQKPSTDYVRSYGYLDSREEFSQGAAFIAVNKPRALSLFRIARWACLPFSVLLTVVCYRWALEAYGSASALLTAALCCVSPMLLGHGSLITPDVGAASLGVAAFFCFRRWLLKSNALQTLLTGAVFGLAQLTKFTWIILFVLWPLIWFVVRFKDSPRQSLRVLFAEAGQLVMILAVGVCVINVAYGFEGSFRLLGQYPFISRSLSGTEFAEEIAEGQNRFGGTLLALVPVPLPENYLRGLDVQRRDFERKRWSYLRGEWRQRGWWWYYFYGTAVKAPLGVLILALSSVLFGTSVSRRLSREDFLLLAPVATILLLISLQTGFSRHLRYLLPALPFIFIFATKLVATPRDLGGRVTGFRERWRSSLATVCLACAATSSLWAYPHSLAYFNELVGGPKKGHNHLLDSNIDWGQDLLFLKDWLDDHHAVDLNGFAYSLDGQVDPSDFGITSQRPPTGPTGAGANLAARDPASVGPLPGWYAISVNHLRDWRGEYAYFLKLEPTAYAGYSIHIYHISLDQANAIRRRLGLSDA